ncbi:MULTISPECIES: hypothetical protein [unclassified Streptomyces]|uniref:hypothetical protein n=1 Tax=unclassified Streptomyces TaxID=2593676 RepID=UPI003323F905
MSTDSEYEEYGGGPDALMAAITGEPLSREARRDPAFLAEHRAARADLAALRAGLERLAEELDPPEEARGTATRPAHPARTTNPAHTTAPAHPVRIANSAAPPAAPSAPPSPPSPSPRASPSSPGSAGSRPTRAAGVPRRAGPTRGPRGRGPARTRGARPAP